MLPLIMSRKDKESCRQFIEQIEDNNQMVCLLTPQDYGIGRDVLFLFVFP